MKALNMKTAIERYNRIMFDICREYLTIGTNYSEDTEGWNIRDLVSECQYTLDCYYEDGNANEELRHGDEYERKMWRSDTGKLSRFIKAYEPFIEGVNCTVNHCSKYDNRLRDYVPSSENGDYSPSNPWDAPGMSISDFI